MIIDLTDNEKVEEGKNVLNNGYIIAERSSEQS